MPIMKNKKVHLEGVQLQIGDKMKPFQTMDIDVEEFDSQSLQGIRIYLSIPSVDTSVCSLELSKFMNYLKKYEDVTCVSVSMDLPFALKRWCQLENNSSIITTSDYKDLSFAKVSGTRIQENGLLTRAVIVVDHDDIVKHVEYVENVSNEPDYQKVLDVIETLR